MRSTVHLIFTQRTAEYQATVALLRRKFAHTCRDCAIFDSIASLPLSLTASPVHGNLFSPRFCAARNNHVELTKAILSRASARGPSGWANILTGMSNPERLPWRYQKGYLEPILYHADF